MNTLFSRILLCVILFPFLATAQEMPDPLVPTERITYGSNDHTSRDAIFFSEKDSRGNLIVAGYTERDFSFADVKIISLNENLEENWSNQLSWDGVSYDYPMNLLLDKDDHIWVISKNYIGGSEANYIIVRFSPSGEKLWEYKSPESLESHTLNVNQYYYFIDDDGYLNFTYREKPENGDLHLPQNFFRISPEGIPSEEFQANGPFSHLSYSGEHYKGFSLKYINQQELLYYVKFNKTEYKEEFLDLNVDQISEISNTLFEKTTSSFIDRDGNYIYVGGGKFINEAQKQHPGNIILSISPANQINFYVEDEGITDKYILDAFVNDKNEIILLSNTQPNSDVVNEPFLTLEKYANNGDLLFKKRIEAVTGNMGKIADGEILVRTLSGDLHKYDLDLNLLESIRVTPTEVFFQPQDLHSINGNTFLVGTTISSKYEGSDFVSEQNYYVRKFENQNLTAEFNYNGEGTSGHYYYHMIQDTNSDILVSCREFYGPNNLLKGGSRAPYKKKVIRFNSKLEYLNQEVVEENFHLWKEPDLTFEAMNGDHYRYEISEDEKTIHFYKNEIHTWERSLFLGAGKISYQHVIDKEGNLLITSTLYESYEGKIHKLSPENDYKYIPTGDVVGRMAILDNDKIFSFLKDYSIRVYSPELELLSHKQFDKDYFDGESYPTLMVKNNKVLLNVRHRQLVMVFNQFGDYESRFRLDGQMHPSVAFFDENDVLNVYHTVGKGVYLAHGFSWTRLAISRYSNIVDDFIGQIEDRDQDGDGVLDFSDLCPNTPAGQPVNEKGCPIIILPEDNFSLSTRDETCKGKNNGHFRINVLEEHNYIVNLNGEEHDFNLGLSFEMLSPGNYTACMSVKDQPHTEKCFEFEIKPGRTFEADSKIDNKTMTVKVKDGSGPFHVRVNGIESGIYHNSNFDISIHDGDRVVVKSSKICEGNLEFLVSLANVHLVSNPVDEEALIVIPGSINDLVFVQVYTSSSQLVFSEKLKPDNDQKLRIDTSAFPTGIYYVQVQLGKLHSLKLIKK
ncbi:T9SS type A sorting domain-containing protein [Christiangramia aquimixticola]|uniref:T9SS type A sorting domain-containing protein n=1 Tax=Christiangramia aquimixticola TaxID=1697558 RepID=UPI003AA9BBB9